MGDFVLNVAALAGLWIAYTAVRTLTADSAQIAFHNAQRIVEFQAHIGLEAQSHFQEVLDNPVAFVGANMYYLVHFPFTVGMLLLSYVVDRAGVFVRLRNGLIAVTSVALVIHVVMPLAPPRMLPGFVDVGSLYGPDPYAIPGSEGANQFAAMPSMHVAWALLAGAAAWQLTRRRTVRVGAVLHPLITTVVVLITAHHYVVDAVAGAVLALVAMCLARKWAAVRLPSEAEGTAGERVRQSVGAVAGEEREEDQRAAYQ